jgi:predicted nucleic acid-binding protein
VKLFLDSGALIARTLSNDANHDAAIDMFRLISNREVPYQHLYTSNFVVDETITFLLYQAGARPALEVLGWVRDSPNVRVLHVSEDVEADADREFRRFARSRVSYTDCTTKVLSEREAIDAVFSFDRDMGVLGLTRVP